MDHLNQQELEVRETEEVKKTFAKPELTRHESLVDVTNAFFGQFGTS